MFTDNHRVSLHDELVVYLLHLRTQPVLLPQFALFEELSRIAAWNRWAPGCARSIRARLRAATLVSREPVLAVADQPQHRTFNWENWCSRQPARGRSPFSPASGRAVDSPPMPEVLPATAGCLALVTSRRRLTALETSVSLALDTLPADEATRLFARLSGRSIESADAEPVAYIAEMCGYLPLAIALLAGRLRHRPSWSVWDLADSLRATRNRLGEFRAEDLAVASAFEMSYQDLDAAQQRFFRCLGLHPGSELDAWSTAAVASVAVTEAREHLEGLYDDHFLDEPTRGRYRMHDLVREYSRSLGEADAAGDRDTAFQRLIRYYEAATAKADGFITADLIGEAPQAATSHDSEIEISRLSTRSEAWDWMRSEYANVLACVDRIMTSASAPPVAVIKLAGNLATFFEAVGPWDRALELHEAAADVAHRASDRLDCAQAVHRMGRLQRLIGLFPASISALNRAAEMYTELDHKRGQVRTLGQLGGALRQVNEYSKAADAYLRALDICRAAGDRPEEAASLNGLGIIRFTQGRLILAVEVHQQALEIFSELDDRLGQASARNELGVVKRVIGDYVQSIGHHSWALEVYSDLNDGYHHAFTLNNLGTSWRMTERYDWSVQAHEEAIGISSRLGDLTGQAVGLGEISASLRLMNQFDSAMETGVRAQEIFESIDNMLGIAETMNERGALLLAMREPAEAIELHGRALEIARQIGTPLEQARALEGAGRCAASLGEVDLAVEKLYNAIELYRRLGAAETATDMYRSLMREGHP